MLERVLDIFPKDNPYGSFVERLIVGDSPERTGNMAEGIPHQYIGAGPNDPIIRPQILDLAGALPVASTLKLANLAVPLLAKQAVPAAMATSAAALNRLKAPGSVAHSMDDIGAALLGQSLQRKIPLDDAMVTYHGSPYEFDAFDSSKIGTGEGAQAKGHGLYLAENPETGIVYRKSVSFADTKRKFLDSLPEDAEFDEVSSLIGKGHFSESQERVIKALEANDWLGFDYPSQAISAAYHPKLVDNYDPSPELVEAVENAGHLYEVDLPDEAIARMIDWDSPLSGQPETVREALKKAKRDLGMGDLLSPYVTGRQYYKMMRGSAHMPRQYRNTGDAGVSEYLRSLGIPGIKYYDAGSRGAGAGTRNFVVFDDKLPKILSRNGKPINAMNMNEAQPSVDEFIGKLLDDELPKK